MDSKAEAIDDNQAPVALAATGGAAGGGRSKVDAMLAALLPPRGPARPEATATSIRQATRSPAAGAFAATVAASRRESLVPRAAGIGRWEKPATLDERTKAAPAAEGAPELDPLRRALQAWRRMR